jgi:hypothetical protein
MAGLGCNLLQAKMAFKDGNRLYKEENFKLAIEEYEKVCSLEPDFPRRHFYLASSHQSLYRPGKDTVENRMRLEDRDRATTSKSLEVNKAETPGLQKLLRLQCTWAR